MSTDTEARVVSIPYRETDAEALDNAHEAHRQDLAIISEWLLAEARRRDWCTDYDRLIQEVNGRLSMPLTERVRLVDGEVAWTEHLTVEIMRRAHVTGWLESEVDDQASSYTGSVTDLGRVIRLALGDRFEDDDNVVDVSVTWEQDDGISFDAD